YPGFPRQGAGHALPGHFRRTAQQARLPQERGRRPAEGEPCRGHRPALGLERKRAPPRPHVRQRDARRRRGDDGPRARPGTRARIGEEATLAEFYPKLGDTLKKYYAGWRCYLFSGDARLPKLIRLTASKRTPLYNGPLECRLYEYLVVAGSNRKKSARSRKSGPDT